MVFLALLFINETIDFGGKFFVIFWSIRAISEIFLLFNFYVKISIEQERRDNLALLCNFQEQSPLKDVIPSLTLLWWRITCQFYVHRRFHVVIKQIYRKWIKLVTRYIFMHFSYALIGLISFQDISDCLSIFYRNTTIFRPSIIRYIICIKIKLRSINWLLKYAWKSLFFIWSYATKTFCINKYFWEFLV